MILNRPSVYERRLVVKQCNHSIEELVSKLPRRCFITGKWLFMKPAVKVSRIIVANFATNRTELIQHFWVDPKEYTLLLLGKQ